MKIKFIFFEKKKFFFVYLNFFGGPGLTVFGFFKFYSFFCVFFI